jgi:glutaredoxin 3
MINVTLYVTPICPYCVRAKALFNKLGIEYQTIDVSATPELRQEMMTRAGGKTSVPQIFIDDIHIGGCDDLYEQYNEGKLRQYLTKA